MSVNNQSFKKILGYAKIGMANELRGIQERIILRHHFGEQAIEFPDSHNPLRGSYRTIAEQQKVHDDLQELLKWTAEVLDKVQDFEINNFIKQQKQK